MCVEQFAHRLAPAVDSFDQTICRQRVDLIERQVNGGDRRVQFEAPGSSVGLATSGHAMYMDDGRRRCLNLLFDPAIRHSIVDQ